MMAKEPAGRFQTPAEVARALTPFFKPGPVETTPGRTRLSAADGTILEGTPAPAGSGEGADHTLPDPGWEGADRSERARPGTGHPA